MMPGPGRHDWLRMATILILLLTIGSPLAIPSVEGQNGNGHGQSGQVGVLNGPPMFNRLDVRRDDGEYKVDLVVMDVNGWRDITHVDVELQDGNGKVTAAFTFKQYNENGTEIADRFEDTDGNWLDGSRSSVKRSDTGDIYTVRCSLNVTFFFKPGNGAWIQVSVFDRFNASAISRGPYVAAMTKVPAILRNPVATLSISLIAAIAVCMVVLRGRYASDKLARSIEKRMKETGRKETLDDMMERKR